jgi:hypothetical protein
VIVAVEGPSAAGKTTWAEMHAASGAVVREAVGLEPPHDVSVGDVAEFWAATHARRWAEAIRIEAELGIAVCDTDPLKLHYDYCLARLGRAPWDRFDAGVSVAAEAMARRRIGIVDVVLISVPDDETLRRQRRADPVRRRRNFELHRTLVPGLRDWYGALNRIDPGRVVWQFPSALPTPIERARYDPELFSSWMAQLPRPIT